MSEWTWPGREGWLADKGDAAAAEGDVKTAALCWLVVCVSNIDRNLSEG